MKKSLSHLDKNNKIAMVDVSDKDITSRIAIASAEVHFPKEVWDLLEKRKWISHKGSILEVARIAGIQAAKQTANLIPLCHVLPLSWIDIQLALDNQKVLIHSQVKTDSKTGVEMEALTAASVSALTLYDMCKALSHDIVLSNVKLISKTGGKSDNHEVE